MEIIKHPVDSNETCHVEFPPLFTFTVSHQRTLCVSPSSKKCENAVDMFSTDPAVDEARIATRTPAQDNRNYFSHYLLLQALHGPTRLRASPAGTLKLVTFRKQKEPTQMQDKKNNDLLFCVIRQTLCSEIPFTPTSIWAFVSSWKRYNRRSFPCGMTLQ